MMANFSCWRSFDTMYVHTKTYYTFSTRYQKIKTRVENYTMPIITGWVVRWLRHWPMTLYLCFRVPQSGKFDLIKVQKKLCRCLKHGQLL